MVSSTPEASDRTASQWACSKTFPVHKLYLRDNEKKVKEFSAFQGSICSKVSGLSQDKRIKLPRYSYLVWLLSGITLLSGIASPRELGKWTIIRLYEGSLRTWRPNLSFKRKYGDSTGFHVRHLKRWAFLGAVIDHRGAPFTRLAKTYAFCSIQCCQSVKGLLLWQITILKGNLGG